MSVNIYSVILASGKGERLPNRENLPKQFLSILNDPILVMTLKQFLSIKRIKAHFIVVAKEWIDYTKSIFAPLKEKNSEIYIVEGSSDRQGSIIKGLEGIKDQFGIEKEDIVITHDAVRPFIFKEIIVRNIESLIENKNLDGVNTVIPATDTIVVSKDHQVIDDIPPRDGLYRGQTPQTFKLEILYGILKEMSLEERLTLTDACKALLLRNKKVGLIYGSLLNIKITTPDEFNLARVLFGSFVERIDGTYYL
jgi:2-C-methyl-D-erythritol 4-phosphate cytidylyltransferase